MFPELFTQRLVLQEILRADQPFIFEGLSHSDVIPFYGVSYNSLEATSVQMEWYTQMMEKGTGISWKIVDKASAKPMGVISVYHYKIEHNRAELGFWLLPAYWKRGFMKEAMQAVIDYWQHEKGIHRLEAFVEAGNTSSMQSLERMCFTHEGTMQDCEVKNGRYISLHIYSLLTPDELNS
jgi:[ribosomal protein S5]-alanine N-acetyltransferase